MSVNRHPRLLTAGITFRDLVISGIDELPGLGEERYGTDFVTTWGGVANTARIGASLGARVQLLTGLGDDPNSEMCRRELTEWGIDLTPSPINPGWTLPVTMSQAPWQRTPFAAALQTTFISAWWQPISMRVPL